MTENDTPIIDNTEKESAAETVDPISELSPEMQERWAKRTAPSGDETRPAADAAAATDEADEAGKLPWYKHSIVKKIGFALISLVVALALWGYVLMRENPARTKRIDNVRLAFEGGSEADLRARNLVINGDISTLLPTVAVNVNTTLNDLPRFSKTVGDVATATVSLAGIREPGTYNLRVNATSTIGDVYSVEPSTVSITVENYHTRSIPVTCSFINSLPDGYWRDEPQIMTQSISVSGAESAISSIVQANCVIDLSGKTSSINESVELVLLDAQQQPVDASQLVVSNRYATVKLTVLPYVEIDVASHITMMGNLNENYEIVSTAINPGSIMIAAPQDVIDSLTDSIYLEPIVLSELTTGINTVKLNFLGLPAGSMMLTDNNFILSIDVVEKIIKRTFRLQLTPDDLIGSDRAAYSYDFSTNIIDVEFTGPSSIVNAIHENQLKLELDVSGLAPGPHTAQPKLRVKGDPDWYTDEVVTARTSLTVLTITSIGNER